MVNGMKLSDEELCKVVGGGATTVTQEEPADGVEKWHVHAYTPQDKAIVVKTVETVVSAIKKIENFFTSNRRKPIPIIS